MVTYNIKFPLRDDNDKNTYFQLSTLPKEAYSSDLLFLLLTQKGERWYEPEFGTNLLKYIFEPNIDTTAVDVEQEIKRIVPLYIPSLKIDNVTFNWNKDDEGNTISDSQLNVNIKFTYTEDVFSEQGQLDLNF